MHVTYCINGEQQDLDIETNDDLRSVLGALEIELRTLHPQINQDQSLLVKITEGMLNSFADGHEDVTLGELVGASPAS